MVVAALTTRLGERFLATYDNFPLLPPAMNMLVQRNPKEVSYSSEEWHLILQEKINIKASNSPPRVPNDQISKYILKEVDRTSTETNAKNLRIFH